MTKRLSKQVIIEYLLGHFRYHTMNSWNRSESYAANVKVHKFVPNDLIDRAFDILSTEGPFEDIRDLLQEFAIKHNYVYQVGFNGRSNGYLVLYVGGEKDGRRYTSGVSIDGDEFSGGVFKEYSFTQLKDRYKLVQDFDKLVEDCKNVFLGYCKSYEVVNETIRVDRVIKVMKPLEVVT